MNPAVRCILWINELISLKDTPDILVARLDEIVNKLLEENNDEVGIRTMSTILRTPIGKYALGHRYPESVTKFAMKYITKNGHELLAKYGNPYTEEEVQQGLVDQ
jgi:hypothetical protein